MPRLLITTRSVKTTANMAEWVQQARLFARGPYTEALAQGDKLPQAEFDAIATKVAAFTGLSVEYVKESKLKISATRFRKELLRGDERITPDGTMRGSWMGIPMRRERILGMTLRILGSAAYMLAHSTITSRKS